ncbi:MAG: hypothetical protein ACQGVK_23840 [Myxococcota bacterium]
MTRRASAFAVLALWAGLVALQSPTRPAVAQDAAPADAEPRVEARERAPRSEVDRADADAEAARQARIRRLVAAIRADQAALMAIITEPSASAQVEDPAETSGPDGSQIPPLPLREEVRELARRLPELQRELRELGGESALLDSPAVYR